jgi:transcriptional regulator with XRE-family HTH domain
MAVASPINMQEIGERVLLLRRRGGLSQHGLAAKAGVDVMTISRLERGDKKRLEIEPLARLAQALGVTTDHLLGLDRPGRPRPRRPAAAQVEQSEMFPAAVA